MESAESHTRLPRRPELAGIVELLWYVADPTRDGFELGMPALSAQLIVNLTEDRLTAAPLGGRADALTVCGAVGIAPIVGRAVVLDRREQRRIAGAVLRPEAAGIFTRGASGLGLLAGLDDVAGRPTAQLTDTVASGRDASEVLDRLEDALVELLPQDPTADATAARAITGLQRGTSVAMVADDLGLSASTLTRRFRAATGMVPKQYQRLLRLNRALAIANRHPTMSWAEVAVTGGCYDQAHLTHEFTELAGLTPQQWRRSGDGSRHVHLGPELAPSGHGGRGR